MSLASYARSIGWFLAFVLGVSLAQDDDFLYGTFPDGFQWGTAGSAYQIEGAWNEDGKGLSIWDTFCHEGGHVNNNSTGDAACNSYHQYAEDIFILKNLGVNFYRFSLSWPRILPDGTLSVVNEVGIDFYNRLIDGLIAEGIQPVVTLYFWDLPQALENVGGWRNPDIADYFSNYARLCFQRFGDRVKLWITINEPYSIAWFGYGTGMLAPGTQTPDVAPYEVAHNIIRSHAEAWHTYDSEFRATQNGRISFSLYGDWGEPYTNSTEDIEAAERSMQFKIGWFANPILVNGDYPQIMKDNVARKSQQEGRNTSRLPEFTDEEKARILGTYDFFGLSHYTSLLIENFNHDGNPTASYEFDSDVQPHIDPTWPASGAIWLWEVPWGIRKNLNWIKDHYNNPEVLITENGVSDDRNYVDGSLDDQQRIRYHTGYINNVLKAIQLDGCNVAGYSAWSLMDSFEWMDGYRATCGLHQVNFSDPSLPRVPKQSAYFYNQLIIDHGWPLP